MSVPITVKAEPNGQFRVVVFSGDTCDMQQKIADSTKSTLVDALLEVQGDLSCCEMFIKGAGAPEEYGALLRERQVTLRLLLHVIDLLGGGA